MISIGTDIILVSRIKELIIKNKGSFLKKIFTSKEIEYCNAFSNSYVHFSGKYAAKEAVKKALLSKKIVKTISIKNIQVLNNSDKSPYIKINNLESLKCNVSISHDGNYAIAFVILEK